MSNSIKFSKEVHEKYEAISVIAERNLDKLKYISSGDDWSFILKTMALVESALNRLLVSQTKDAKFEKVFSRMSISNKINIAYDLSFFTSKYEKMFLEYLVELRNKLAHDPDEMDFNFEKYFSMMTYKEKQLFEKRVVINDEKKDKEYYEFIYKYPKQALLIMVNSILSVFAFRQGFNEVTNWVDESTVRNLPSTFSSLFSHQVDKNLNSTD